jgi:Ca2+-binding RTX toxin-like protein
MFFFTYTPPTYEVALSKVVVPIECKGRTYTHAFDARGHDGVIVNGTSGNDIIFVNNYSVAYGKGGNDCIVGNNSNYLSGGDGNDTLVSRGGGNYLDGGNGYDTAYYYYYLDAINSIENEIVLD